MKAEDGLTKLQYVGLGCVVMKTVVTIGVCVRNCASSLREAIGSIISQDFPHELMEVIFVDDGSEDTTLSIMTDGASKMDMRVEVIHQEWRGLGPARNIVVNNASGDYIIWVDGDMTLLKNFVKKQVGFMEQNPTVGIAKGRCGKCGDARPLKNQRNLVATLQLIEITATDFKYGGKASQKLPGTAGCIYRVKAIRQVGGFDENIKGAGEDTDAAYRVRKAGWLIYFATEAIFHARRKETWRSLWDQQFWHGYGLHYVLHKNGSVVRTYKMVPPAGFVMGLLLSSVAYKLTFRKAVFLLPLYWAFKATARCSGFAKSHIDFHRHINKV